MLCPLSRHPYNTVWICSVTAAQKIAGKLSILSFVEALDQALTLPHIFAQPEEWSY